MTIRIHANLLMIVGFIPTLICVSLLQFAELSSTEHALVTSIQYLGTGIGSIGFGMRIILRGNKY